jgi:hypothetical protein
VEHTGRQQPSTATGTVVPRRRSVTHHARGLLIVALATCGALAPSPARAGSAPSLCIGSQTTLCLSGGRFSVTAQWSEPDGESGAAQAYPVSDDTASFWFFSSANLEMLVKVLNGCGVNSNYWFFAGGLTNLAVTITVTDTQSGHIQTYTNPQNSPFAPIQDTAAFATCP